MKKLYMRCTALCAAAALMLTMCVGCGNTQESSDLTAEIRTETTIPSDTAQTTTAPEITAQTSATTQTTAEETTVTAVSETTSQQLSQTAPADTVKRQTTTAARTTTIVTTTKAAPKATAADDMAALIRSYPRDCAVLLYSMDGTTLYSYRADEMISGASLIKLPFVYYCCTQIENGAHSLDETMTYIADYYQGGAGIIGSNGVGKQYTVAQLIDYTLRYSDNIAYYMLVSLFGTDGFNQMVADWGYSIRITQSARFPSVSASFMKTAMQKMQQRSNTGECWALAWKALNESSRSVVRATVGGTNPVAAKYGSIKAQYHETCYVSGETPYILVLLSGAVNYQPDDQFVADVAKCAARIVDEYQASLTTTATTSTTITTTSTSTITTATTDTVDTTTITEITQPEFTTPDRTVGHLQYDYSEP